MSSVPAAEGNGEAAPVVVIPEVHPPPAFACVSPYIFRSGDPSQVPDSFAYLSTLKLKTIMLMSIEYPSRMLEEYCKSNNIDFKYYGIDRRWPTPAAADREDLRKALAHTLFLSPGEINSTSVLESIIKDGLEVLVDERNHPALVLDTWVADLSPR